MATPVPTHSAWGVAQQASGPEDAGPEYERRQEGMRMDIGECPKPRSLVDMVLGFMGEPLLGPLFACEVDAYLSITGTPGERLGLAAVGEAAFVRRLRAGHALPPSEVDRARRWTDLHSSSAQRRAIAAATLYRTGGGRTWTKGRNAPYRSGADTVATGCALRRGT